VLRSRKRGRGVKKGGKRLVGRGGKVRGKRRKRETEG